MVETSLPRRIPVSSETFKTSLLSLLERDSDVLDVLCLFVFSSAFAACFCCCDRGPCGGFVAIDFGCGCRCCCAVVVELVVAVAVAADDFCSGCTEIDLTLRMDDKLLSADDDNGWGRGISGIDVVWSTPS